MRVAKYLPTECPADWEWLCFARHKNDIIAQNILLTGQSNGHGRVEKLS